MPHTWASIRAIKRHIDSDRPADSERLAIVRSQVVDACDRGSWCFVYSYEDGRHHYVHWLDAVDLLWEHRATLTDPVNNNNLEVGGRL